MRLLIIALALLVCSPAYANHIEQIYGTNSSGEPVSATIFDNGSTAQVYGSDGSNYTIFK